jgi:hypothetical protein
MSRLPSVRRTWTSTLGILSIGAVALSGGIGCQTDINGQTLPSANYLSDDVQYFAPGLEFKLTHEAAALRAARVAAETPAPAPVVQPGLVPGAMPPGGPPMPMGVPPVGAPLPMGVPVPMPPGAALPGAGQPLPIAGGLGR